MAEWAVMITGSFKILGAQAGVLVAMADICEDQTSEIAREQRMVSFHGSLVVHVLPVAPQCRSALEMVQLGEVVAIPLHRALVVLRPLVVVQRPHGVHRQDRIR